MTKQNLFVRVLRGIFVGAILVIFTTSSFGQIARASDQELNKELRRQKNLIGHLNPTDKVALWRQHLKNQLDTRTFTNGQTDVIKKAF